MSAKRSDAKLYEKFKVTAPEMLAQIIQVLALCHKLDIHVPRGVKNLFEFTWEELTITTERKVIIGEYCPVVHLVHTMETSFSSTTYKSHTRRKSLPKSTISEPSYLSPSAENQQILLKFQQRSVHLLSELLKLKMKAMIDSVTGKDTSVTSSFLSLHRQNTAVTTMEPVPGLGSYARTSMEQLVYGEKGVNVTLAPPSLCADSQGKGNKKDSLGDWLLLVFVSTFTFAGSPKFKPMQEAINVDHQHDPCPEARQKLREMCQHIYPTGNIAACQFPMCCVGKTITLLFNNAPSLALLASFIADYQACVRYSFKASCSLALMMDLEGGAVRDRDGYLTHKWSWASKTQTLQSLEFQINEQLKLKVLGQNSITLSFSCLNETINMSLSTAPCAHTPKANKRILAKTSDSEKKEEQLERALEEIKKRFQKTVKQFINAILIASGILFFAYVKFERKELSSQAWAKRVKEERAPMASETKRPQKPPSRPIDRRIPLKPSRRPVDQRKPSIKTVSGAGACPARTWASSIADCPVVLRRLLSKQDAGLGCKCVVKIPFVTDLEFDKFISAPRKSDQILVIFVLSSQNPSYSPFLEWMLQSLYMEKQHGRPSPCVQCRCDPYRLLRYDMDSVTRRKPPLPPLLVRKHAVTPGMVLMYAGGKLLFGGCVFNGYGCSKKDLLNQIGQARLDCKIGHFLPESFKFRQILLPFSHPTSRDSSRHQRRKQVLGAANGKGRHVRVFGGNSAKDPSVPLFLFELPPMCHRRGRKGEKDPLPNCRQRMEEHD
uniref:Chromosome 3 open reading frame 20 n=1 Tax=Chelonoidis abingdonii TaxID=106734 RepID=A0A8C0GDJ1_CHEAB